MYLPKCGSPYVRRNVSGMQRACGSSFEFSADRFLTIAWVSGLYGIPPFTPVAILRPKRDRLSSTPHWRKALPPAPPAHGSTSSVNHIPEKSGLRSALRGVGAVTFGLPSGSRGTPAVGNLIHWATSGAEPHNSAA